MALFIKNVLVPSTEGKRSPQDPNVQLDVVFNSNRSRKQPQMRSLMIAAALSSR